MSGRSALISRFISVALVSMGCVLIGSSICHAASQDVYVWTDTEGQERWSNRPPAMNEVAEDTTVRIVTPRFRNRSFGAPPRAHIGNDGEPVADDASMDPMVDEEAVEQEQSFHEPDTDDTEVAQDDPALDDSDDDPVAPDTAEEAESNDEDDLSESEEADEEEPAPWWEL